MKTKDWHEDDRFWELAAPVMFSEERFKMAVKECEQIEALVPLTSGASILDLACGAGRHGIELANRGFRVTGVDRTPLFVKIARERSAEKGVATEFICQDMRRFSRPGVFDLVVNLGNSFGQFRDPKEEQQVLQNVHTSLKPGGYLILEITGKEVMKRLFRTRDRYGDGCTVCQEEREILGNWEWVRTHLEICKDGVRERFTFDYRLYSGEELKELLEYVGFSSVALHGDLAGRPYDAEALRLVVVARR